MPTTAIPTGALGLTGGMSREGGECVVTAATGAFKATGTVSEMREWQCQPIVKCLSSAHKGAEGALAYAVKNKHLN